MALYDVLRNDEDKGNIMLFMSRRGRIARLLATTLFVAPAALFVVPAHAQSVTPQPNKMEMLQPTGVFISPTAIPGSSQQLLVPNIPNWPMNLAVSEAVKSQLSPDGNTLAIITAGYNLVNLTNGDEVVTQFIFIYDVSGANKSNPKLTQVIQQPDAYVGLAWSGNMTLYASGGPADNVYVYTRAGAAPSIPFAAAGTIPLGHKQGVGINIPNGVSSGLAVSADGKTLVVANNYNESISAIDTASKAVIAEYDLRPYNTSGQNGVAGGEFPWAVALKANGIAFISSVRDREVIAVNLSTPASPKFVTRIALAGNPYGLALSADQSKLFVAQENSDQVAVIDTSAMRVVDTIDTRAPAGVLADRNHHDTHYTGAEPVAVTVSPDGKTLYAVNNGNNSIAVIPLEGKDAYTTTALLPTAHAPKDITFSADGSQIYIINGRSNTGPNPGYAEGVLGGAASANQYNLQLERASLVTAPVPAAHVLPDLTMQVAKNNFYSVQVPENDAKVMDFLRDKIKHVVYIVKENRTFDQILGDLNNGSKGDPSLTMFGAAITPSLHSVAKSFVTLDNFMESDDTTGLGWPWLMQGGISNTTEIEVFNQYTFAAPNFAGNAPAYENGVPNLLPTTAERDAATNGSFSQSTASLPGGTSNVLPGTAEVAGKDAPFGRQKSYIYDAVLHAGGTVRNYGWQANNVGPTTDANGNPISNPYAAGVVQEVTTDADLSDKTDPYFRSYDSTYIDTWRFQEWLREFRQFEASGKLPSLSLLWLPHDHIGSPFAGLNTPEQHVADNDYATGKLIETVAHSQRYANNTLVIVIEDDSQDGPDHVDSHRSTAYVAGPYVKQGAVVSTHYTQLSVLRTIEDILGTEHMNLNTRYTRPMTDVFDTKQSPVWTFNAVASTVLQGTGLQLTLKDLGAKYAEGPVVKPTHDAAYWTEATRGFDFSHADRVPAALFNKVLWEGLMGDKPYPTPHSLYQNVRDDDDEDK